jgi:hypothetical protein
MSDHLSPQPAAIPQATPASTEQIDPKPNRLLSVQLSHITVKYCHRGSLDVAISASAKE